MSDDQLPLPETVRFTSNGTQCVAYCAFDNYGLNMSSCMINYPERPTVQIEYLPHATRVKINDGLWFDTDEESAARIEALFETGKAPK